MKDENFKPAWWLSNCHLQTLWPTFCRSSVKNLVIKRERFELPDGDFVDLDWAGTGSGPIVIILHGLEGSIDSPYAKGMLKTIIDQGWRGVFMHFRCCSGERNRLPRTYHSGETGDLEIIVTTLKKRESNIPIAALGFSLGGNVLLKWLGESGKNNLLQAAVAISVPFELQKTVIRINQGFSKVYQWHLLKSLYEKMQWKFSQQPSPIAIPPLSKLHTLKDFDDAITAPLHGFKNAEDYYQQSSCRQYLQDIDVPTLILQAKDDPFMTEDLLPTLDELSPAVILELTEKGGHVGFVQGTNPWSAEYWLEKRVPRFLKKFLV